MCLLLAKGYEADKITLLLFRGHKGRTGKKGGEIGYDGHKKVKGEKISALVDGNGLPLAIAVSPANVHDSQLYLPTLRRLKIKRPRGRPITRPNALTADGTYDTAEIRASGGFIFWPCSIGMCYDVVDGFGIGSLLKLDCRIK